LLSSSVRKSARHLPGALFLRYNCYITQDKLYNPRRVAAAVSITALAAVGLLTGCGGSSDDASSASEGSSPPLSKAAFIKQADAICKKADQKQKAAVKNLKSNASQAEIEKFVLKTALPPIFDEVDEISELNAPAEDQAKIDKLLQEIEEAAEKAEADPSTVLKGSGPFVPVEKPAADYGFKVCNSPA
jgi:hypothetical protein